MTNKSRVSSCDQPHLSFDWEIALRHHQPGTSACCACRVPPSACLPACLLDGGPAPGCRSEQFGVHTATEEVQWASHDVAWTLLPLKGNLGNFWKWCLYSISKNGKDVKCKRSHLKIIYLYMSYLFNLLSKLLVCLTLLQPCNIQWDCRAAIIMSCYAKNKFKIQYMFISNQLFIFVFLFFYCLFLIFSRHTPKMVSSWFCVMLSCHHLVVRVNNTRIQMH